MYLSILCNKSTKLNTVLMYIPSLSFKLVKVTYFFLVSEHKLLMMVHLIIISRVICRIYTLHNSLFFLVIAINNYVIERSELK